MYHPFDFFKYVISNSGSWRFNPALLNDEHFLSLLDSAITGFFQDQDGVIGSVSTQLKWEAFKWVIQVCAKRYSRNSRSRHKNTLTSLQRHRLQLLSEDTASAANLERIRQIDITIDKQVQKETKQFMLRSATRWHEKGERNNKYFIKLLGNAKLDKLYSP